MTAPIEEDQVLAKIGSVVLVSQLAELLVSFCMTFVLQKTEPLTIEKLEAQRAAERRKTIGYFLAQLRQRATVREDLDELLMRFLEKRNVLIHRVNEIEGWDLRAPFGRQVAMQFLDELSVLTIQVVKIFAGFVRAWQTDSGVNPPLPPGSEGLFSELDNEYRPLIDRLLSERSS